MQISGNENMPRSVLRVLSRLTKQASLHHETTWWSYKMTHESFRRWAHGFPSPAWIIHIDSETFGLIWGVISHEHCRLVLEGFFALPVASCMWRVCRNDITLGMNENIVDHFWRFTLNFVVILCISARLCALCGTLLYALYETSCA